MFFTFLSSASLVLCFLLVHLLRRLLHSRVNFTNTVLRGQDEIAWPVVVLFAEPAVGPSFGHFGHVLALNCLRLAQDKHAVSFPKAFASKTLVWIDSF